MTKHHLEGQQEAAHLPTRSHLGQRLQRLTQVGAKQIGDLIVALSTEGSRLDLDFELHPTHPQWAQLGHQVFFQSGGSFVAELGQPLTGVHQLLAVGNLGLLQILQTGSLILNLIQLGIDLLGMLDHLGQGGAIFAAHLLEASHPLIDLFEATRIGL